MLLAQDSTSSPKKTRGGKGGVPTDQLSKTTRVNKALELLAAGQPIYYTMANGRTGLSGREEGLQMAQTWADVIIYDMEHGPIDFGRFHEFMQGLIEGGPTKSGHRTPAVIPQLGGALDETTMRANYWTIGQCLDLGAHGIHLCHARDPGAVRVLVEVLYIRVLEILLQTGAGGSHSGTLAQRIGPVEGRQICNIECSADVPHPRPLYGQIHWGVRTHWLPINAIAAAQDRLP